MRQKQKEIKKRRTLLKNQYYKEIADGINHAAQARAVEKEFALMKKYSSLCKTKQRKPISDDKLKTHLEEHFCKRNLTASRA